MIIIHNTHTQLVARVCVLCPGPGGTSRTVVGGRRWMVRPIRKRWTRHTWGGLQGRTRNTQKKSKEFFFSFFYFQCCFLEKKNWLSMAGPPSHMYNIDLFSLFLSLSRNPERCRWPQDKRKGKERKTKQKQDPGQHRKYHDIRLNEFLSPFLMYNRHDRQTLRLFLLL